MMAICCRVRHSQQWSIGWPGGIFRSRTVAAARVVTVTCDLDVGKVAKRGELRVEGLLSYKRPA